jgi:hypothetical protein
LQGLWLSCIITHWSRSAEPMLTVHYGLHGICSLALLYLLRPGHSRMGVLGTGFDLGRVETVSDAPARHAYPVLIKVSARKLVLRQAPYTVDQAVGRASLLTAWCQDTFTLGGNTMLRHIIHGFLLASLLVLSFTPLAPTGPADPVWWQYVSDDHPGLLKGEAQGRV